MRSAGRVRFYAGLTSRGLRTKVGEADRRGAVTRRQEGDVSGSAPAADTAAAPVRKDRTHWLYIAVIVAVALGIANGLRGAGFRR
jgi:hypothetical protein